MPIYETWSVGKTHNLEWNARVKINIDGKIFVVETDLSSTSKTNAEKLAAKLMINILDKNKSNDTTLMVADIKTDVETENIKKIYLIDLENSPCFKLKTDPDALYIGFIIQFIILCQSMTKYGHNAQQIKLVQKQKLVVNYYI